MNVDRVVRVGKFFTKIDYLSIFRHFSSSLAIAAAMSGLYLIFPTLIFGFFFLIDFVSRIGDKDGFFSRELFELIGWFIVFILVMVILFVALTLLLASVFITIFSPMHALVNKFMDYRKLRWHDRFTTRIAGTILAWLHLFFWMMLIALLNSANVGFFTTAILAAISCLIAFTYGILYGVQEAITSIFGWIFRKIYSRFKKNNASAKTEVVQFPTTL